MSNTTTHTAPVTALPAPRVRGECRLTIDTSGAGAGVIYLLHFKGPHQHARHCLGWTVDLEARLTEHATGRGSRLLEPVGAHGTGWVLARTWIGDRRRLSAISRQGGLARCCPCCGVTPRGPRYTSADAATAGWSR